MRTIRAFIAIDIPPATTGKIAELQNSFKSLGLDVSWVKPDNFHLTMKFLGNIDINRISEINQLLKTELALTPEFTATITGVGVFPSQDQPRILWVGLESQALIALKKSIDRCMEQVGFARDTKRFTAHLTLGRIKTTRGIDKLKEALKRVPTLNKESFKVTSVKMYESQLTPKGSIYTLLEEYNLGAITCRN